MCGCLRLTLEGQDVQALQAVPAGRRESAALGQAALSAGQNSSGREDGRRRDLPHLLVQLLNLFLLSGLQGLNLGQMSEQRKQEVNYWLFNLTWLQEARS